MAEEPLPQQLTTLGSLLAEVDARLQRAPVTPVGLEDLKQSVDNLRTSMWAILSAGHGVTAPVRVERLKLRRAIASLVSIRGDLATRSDARRQPEHAELEQVARALADQLAALT
ncbi:MAG TPA: hypothetical protein VEI47_01910 [Gemmatimonadales bacterium]|nr:hypothetical protein [Gemmatimonadales bacterium]